MNIALVKRYNRPGADNLSRRGECHLLSSHLPRRPKFTIGKLEDLDRVDVTDLKKFFLNVIKSD